MAEEKNKSQNKKEEISTKDAAKSESKLNQQANTEHQHSHDNHEHSHKHEESKPQQPVQTTEKVEQQPAKPTAQKQKKEEAVANSRNLPLSKKHSMYICSFIKNKDIDTAMMQLKEVLLMKRAIPYKGEIPHRHDLGMMSGRYPIKASGYFINLLKSLKGNALVNGLDASKIKITSASASWASRPQRRGGARFKRVHVTLKAREVAESMEKNKNMKEKK